MRAARFVFLWLGLFLTCASREGAHAFLDSAEPAVGSTVRESPTVVKLWFTRHLKPGVSTFQVLDAQGEEVDLGKVKRDADDPTLMTVAMPKLALGMYKVVWTAVWIDGHTTHGSFTFSVGGT